MTLYTHDHYIIRTYQKCQYFIPCFMFALVIAIAPCILNIHINHYITIGDVNLLIYRRTVNERLMNG